MHDKTKKENICVCMFSFLTDKELMENPLNRLMFDEALLMIDNDSSVKYSLHDAVKLICLCFITIHTHRKVKKL